MGNFTNYLRDSASDIIRDYYKIENKYSCNVTKMSYVRDHTSKEEPPVLKFPWRGLNSALSCGGMPRGIIVLGAPSGVGKTFLSTQIACSIILDSICQERGCGRDGTYLSENYSVSSLKKQSINFFLLREKKSFMEVRG